jgi:hypothetical protein
MDENGPDTPLWRGMVCLDIALTFADDRARIGLAAAVDRLRDALVRNDLWMAGDDELLTRVLADKISPELLAESICSPRRMGLPGAPVVH